MDQSARGKRDRPPFGGGRRIEERYGDGTMASYVLMAIVVALVIYLFYAVINPEKF